MSEAQSNASSSDTVKVDGDVHMEEPKETKEAGDIRRVPSAGSQSDCDDEHQNQESHMRDSQDEDSADEVFSSSDDNGRQDFIPSDSDSEKEFISYLIKTRARRERHFAKEHPEEAKKKHIYGKEKAQRIKKRRVEDKKEEIIKDEYLETWPGLEAMKQLYVTPPMDGLKFLGKLDKIVDSIALLDWLTAKEDLSDVLGLETVVFLKEGKPIGTICDLIGSREEIIYCIKLDPEVQNQGLNKGTHIFYAPDIKNFTKKLKDKAMNEEWEIINQDDVDEEIFFSDDEKERAYLAMKRDEKLVAKGKKPRKRNKNREHVRLENEGFSETHRSKPGNPEIKQRVNKFINKNAEEIPSPPRREPISTHDNPYAEFGTHDTYTSLETTKNVYKR